MRPPLSLPVASLMRVAFFVALLTNRSIEGIDGRSNSLGGNVRRQAMDEQQQQQQQDKDKQTRRRGDFWDNRSRRWRIEKATSKLLGEVSSTEMKDAKERSLRRAPNKNVNYASMGGINRDRETSERSKNSYRSTLPVDAYRPRAKIAARIADERLSQDPSNCTYPPDRSEFYQKYIELMGGEDVYYQIYYVDDNVSAYDLLSDYKRLYDWNLRDEYFGADKSATTEIKNLHDRIQRFWSVTSSICLNDPEKGDLPLKGLHGDDLNDTEKMQFVLMSDYGYNRTESEEIVTRLTDLIAEYSIDLSNPLFTDNAFFLNEFSWSISIPNQIVIGDGSIEFGKWLNLTYDIHTTHAHEYAHYIFHVLGWSNDYVTTPEATRQEELMADYFSGYYNAHPCGESLRTGDICDVYESLFNVGDCDFEEDDHHGTPKQRECAAIVGAIEAYSDPNILDPPILQRRFEKTLPRILDVDATVCPHPDTPEGRAVMTNNDCPFDLKSLDIGRSDCDSIPVTGRNFPPEEPDIDSPSNGNGNGGEASSLPGTKKWSYSNSFSKGGYKSGSKGGSKNGSKNGSKGGGKSATMSVQKDNIFWHTSYASSKGSKGRKRYKVR